MAINGVSGLKEMNGVFISDGECKFLAAFRFRAFVTSLSYPGEYNDISTVHKLLTITHRSTGAASGEKCDTRGTKFTRRRISTQKSVKTVARGPV